jgi:hypothetical protein
MNREFILLQLFAIIISLFISVNAFGQNNHVRIESKPSWVIEKLPDVNIDSLDEESYGGYYYLLQDIQENISQKTMYCHYAIKLFNSDGVQSMSDISVDFDPGFQTLRFHFINRFRNGIKTNELLNHQINTIQREADMERFLYDGRLTAYINLEDIREGDIIEYSYSVEGYNPINKGNYFRRFNLEYSDPLKEIYRRIISPKEKRLYIRYPSGEARPEIAENNGTREYLWHKRGIMPVIYDNNVPSWYNSNLRIEISTFDNWGDVVKLCLDNYKVSDTELARLKMITEGMFEHKEKDSVIVPIIRFVQDEIRYLGFESGLNAYKPTAPTKVMVSRYGDCKAKSLLLCALLKLNNIEASPVLVSSNKIKSVIQVSEAPDVFDHCIVQINYENKVFNIDPTISGQGGAIDNNYIPDYGYGLVLKEGTTALTPLINDCKSETKVYNYFKINKIGDTVSFKVRTEYSGYYANDERSYFQHNSDAEIGSSYLNFYSKTYPLIRTAAPISYKDDRIRNLFVVEEDYVVDSMWMPVKGNKQKMRLEVSAMIINSVTSIPASPERKMPYSVAFPANYTEDIFIDLPKGWDVKPENTEIRDSVFIFSFNSEYRDKQIHLKYKFKTFSDQVNSESFSRYYSNSQEIKNNLAYSLTHDLNDQGPFLLSWPATFAFIIMLVISMLLAIYIYRNYNLISVGSQSREIGGWLVLVAIGLFVSTFTVLYNILFDNSFLDQGTWSALLGKTNNRIPLFLIGCFEFAYNSVLLVCIVLIQILFYKRRNILPRLIIIYYAANLIILILDTFLAYTLSPDSYTAAEKNKSYLLIGRTMIVTAIWIAYFIKSKRVKETFTKVLHPFNKSEKLSGTEFEAGY